MDRMNLPGPLAQALEQSRRGNHAEAERICRQSLAVDGRDPRVWCHLGTCCLATNRLDEAMKAYEQAVKLHPPFAEAINNMGVVSARQRKVDQAIGYFLQARSQRPNWAEPSISLGNLYVTHERFDEAVEAFAYAARVEPQNPEPQTLLGTILARLGRLDRGIVHFRESLRLNPRNPVAHSNLLLAMNYDPDLDPVVLLNEHRWFDRLHGQGLAPVPPFTNPPKPDRPLRIGFLSPDLRRHAVAWFILPVFASLDPKQCELYAYLNQSDFDSISDQFRSYTMGWQVITGKLDAQVAQQIRADGIDILVDLAGHTAGNRATVLGYRPAPVQVSYLGYPNTTGMAAVDYYITDSISDPLDQRSWYTEKLIRLPGSFCCFQPPSDIPDVSPAPVEKNGYVTFGLLHKMAKYNPKMLDLWSEVLKASPSSRMLIHRDSLESSVQKYLLQQFVDRGIDPARIEFDKRSAREGSHYSTYARIDISLDSLPWSGHTTSCESMWMGVPFVTMRGSNHAGRMAASILQTVGVNELIAEDPQEYVRIGTELAGSTERIKKYRTELRQEMQRSPLCDAKKFTRGLEAAFRRIWQGWCISRDPHRGP